MQVVKLIKGWNLHLEKHGGSGTRVYIDAAFAPAGATIETLPSVGDKWSEQYPQLFVERIRGGFLADNCRVLTFTVSYISAQQAELQLNQFSHLTQLPATISVSSELQTINVTPEIRDFNYSGMPNLYAKPNEDGTITASSDKGVWVWPDGDVASTMRIGKREPTISVRLTRYIYGGNAGLAEFVQLSNYVVGSVNATSFLGVPEGCAMFLGADIRQRTEQDGSPKWIAELEFKIKLIKQDDEYVGWNYIHDPNTNKYIKANINDETLYQEDMWNFITQTSNIPTAILPPILDGEVE
jgi:hypothetical protein